MKKTTTLDDVAIISQLDIDAHHISTTVKQMRENLKMPEMALGEHLKAFHDEADLCHMRWSKAFLMMNM